MYDKNGILTSIPENNETEDVLKWIPKKKHEVLKAKYKCLKKLFQIYDASVIGLLPQNYSDTNEEPEKKHRRKRSHRTKTDACAGTTELSSGDVSTCSIDRLTATSVLKDVNLHKYASSELSTVTKIEKNDKSDKSTQDSKEDVSNIDRECESVQTLHIQHPIPYLVYNEKRKPTRFQNFISRIFGIKPQRTYNVSPTGHIYAASDNNISHRYEKRRRRGLRFRRRRPKKIHSEMALRNMKHPLILSYVQSVQRSCLMDTTPRQCPILGCRMIFYGIINYNDHLNLCHFPDRKYICHYCHEGFSKEYDKVFHENEHLGITKIAATLPSSPAPARQSVKIASNTQTDQNITNNEVPEEKLKKIVSFFDKISDPDQVLDQMKNKRSYTIQSDSLQETSKSDIEGSKFSDSEKRIRMYGKMHKPGGKCISSVESEVSSNYHCGHQVSCRFCGENFNYRRQLSLHVDLEHRVHDKFSKFHSCPGIVNRKTTAVVSEDGKINVQSVIPVSSRSTCVSRRKSNTNCDPSTTVVYYTSAETLRKPSVVGSFVQKIRSYKWEPSSKVIRA